MDKGKQGPVIRNRRGFSLMEIVVAVGILTVAGALMARMFVMAGNIEKKTDDLDRALVASQNLMELFRSGADWSGGRLTWEAGGDFCGKVDEGTEGLYAEAYFDSRWQPSPVPAGDGYTIYLEAARTDRSQAGGLLCSVAVKAVRHPPYSLEAAGETEICMLRTEKYFEGTRR